MKNMIEELIYKGKTKYFKVSDEDVICQRIIQNIN